MDADLAQQFNLTNQSGILVDDVLTNTPADKGGIKSGDVIVALNGKNVADSTAMKMAIAECSPGSVASIKLVRNGAEKTITVKLDTLPGDIAQTGGSQNPSAQANAGALDGMKASDVNDNLRQRLQIPTDIKGAVVTNVDENSIAANSGLQQNDVILEINRHAVAGANDVTNLVKQAAGPRVLFKLWRSENGSAGTVFLSVDNAKRNN